MEYLVRLVTPPGVFTCTVCDVDHASTKTPSEVSPVRGIVLDPFAGSGSTLVAAATLGFPFIGIEKEAEYVGIARQRVGPALAKAQENRPGVSFLDDPLMDDD